MVRLLLVLDTFSVVFSSLNDIRTNTSVSSFAIMSLAD